MLFSALLFAVWLKFVESFCLLPLLKLKKNFKNYGSSKQTLWQEGKG